MDRMLQPGSVVVMASGGFRAGAVLGGNIGLSFKLHGCAGIVTDGGIRDGDEFMEFGLPVFCAFTTPLAYKGRWHYEELQVPIALEGLIAPVRVQPGDLVHADIDGALIIPREHAEQVAADAQIVEQMEGRIKDELQRGTDREVVYGRNDRFSHVKRVL
jgi:regulator of RNase E activity RraA